MLRLDPVSSPQCTGSGRRNNPQDGICERANDRPDRGKFGLKGSFHQARKRSFGAFSCRSESLCLEEGLHKAAYDDAHRCVTAVFHIIAATPRLVLVTISRT